MLLVLVTAVYYFVLFVYLSKMTLSKGDMTILPKKPLIVPDNKVFRVITACLEKSYFDFVNRLLFRLSI